MIEKIRIIPACLENFFRFAVYNFSKQVRRTLIEKFTLIMKTHQILVVDDDKSIIEIVRAYLEQAGYNVLTADNGTSAMNILRSEKPDLLILDLMLPDRDGWDITRSIRHDKRLSAIPIIMLTARVDDSDKIIGLELGAVEHWL